MSKGTMYLNIGTTDDGTSVYVGLGGLGGFALTADEARAVAASLCACADIADMACVKGAHI